MLKTKSTTETMGSSEISDQNDGLDGFNELEPTLPPRRKGSLRKAALEAAAEHGDRDEDAPKRKRGRPKADNPFSVVFTLRMRPSMLNFAAKRAAAASCVNSLNSICCSLARFGVPINRRLKPTASMLH